MSAMASHDNGRRQAGRAGEQRRAGVWHGVIDDVKRSGVMKIIIGVMSGDNHVA